jgi:hypothetical protein
MKWVVILIDFKSNQYNFLLRIPDNLAFNELEKWPSLI